MPGSGVMNPQPPPPLPTAAPPAAPSRCQSRCGCVPFLVFLLALVCALSFGALRWLEPKEEAGRVVMEFLEQNSEAEMKAHAARVTTGEVLHKAIKRSGTVEPLVMDELRARLAQHTEVSVSGPHLTITVYEHRKSPAAQAGFLAQALNEDLIELAGDRMRRFSQSLQSELNKQVVAVEKARLERNDLMVKYDLAPAKTAAADAQVAELSARLAKWRADLVMVEARFKATPETDPARAALAVEQAAIKAALEEYAVQAAQWAKEQSMHFMNRWELDAGQERYDSARALLQKLRAELEDLRIRESVVLRPTRVVSEPRTVPVPARGAQKFLRFTAAASAVLLGALLLSAAASKLLRRV
jgi:hypothetical protein